MKKIQKFVFYLFIFTIPLQVRAELYLDTIKVKYKLNPIVVTATKVKGVERDLTASISLINNYELQQAPSSSVLETIKTYVPSFYLTEWGVMGFGAAGESAGKISLRGIGGGPSTHVLILRNGRPDFMGLMGCTITDEFSASGVEKVEVIRGPGSFLYGTNAMGGVINLIPAHLKKSGFKTKIASALGTYNTRKISLSHMGKQNKFEYHIAASFKKTNGHRSDADNSFRSGNISLHINYQISPRTQIEFNSNFADIHFNDPGTITEPKIDNWYDLIRYGGDCNILHNSRWGETNIKLHGNFGHHEFYDGWQSFDRMVGIMVYHNFHIIKNNTTTIGFDIKDYGGEAEDVDDATDYGSYYLTEYAPYIFTKQILLRHFILSAGLRMERSDIYKNELIPKIGINSHITNSTSLRFSVAKGFRTPSLRELYFFPSQNAELKPERLWNYEAGITQYVGRSLKLETVVFKSEGDNLIRRSNPGFPFKWINSGEFVHTGYEVIFQWIPSEMVTMDFSWSQIEVGNETLYTPGKKLSGNIFIKKYGCTLHSNLLTIMELYGEDFQKKPMDDYTLLNLSLELPAIYNITLGIQIKNVMDTEYEAMYGYPMPGRHVFMDINYSF
ncbi:MAG: TonB-dependent receptor [bacterium]